MAQTSMEDLQDRFLNYRTGKQQDSALITAREMTRQAKLEFGDSSFWYAIGLRFQGNVHKTLNNQDSLLFFWNQAIDVFSMYMPQEPNHADVVNALALYYYEIGAYKQAISFCEKSIELREAFSRDDHADYADFINNSAVIYAAAKEWSKAKEAYQHSYEMYVRLLGKKHPSCLNSLTNQARLFDRIGEDSLAERRYKEVVDTRREMHGNDHLDLANALTNIGIFYYYRARYKNALDQFNEAANIRKKLLGEVNLPYASSLETLGAINWKLGNYTDAETFYQQCVAIRQELLGVQHPDVGTVINNLAVLMVDKGDFPKAESFYKQSLEIKRTSVGEQHTEYALVLNNLGNFYGKMAQHEEGIAMIRQSAEIRRSQLGAEHPLYASSLNSLGVLQMKISDYPNAEKSLEEAGKIFSKSPGVNSAEYVWYLNNIGLLFTKMGESKKAENALLSALEVLEVIYGKKHPEYANTLNNLGELYFENEEIVKAERCYLEAKEIRRQQLGESNPSFAESLVSLGNLYFAKGELEKTEYYHQQALTVRRNCYGPSHPEYAVGLNNLGIFYKKIGAYLKAAMYLSEALTINEKVYGKESALCASMQINLGLLYHDIGYYDTAIVYLMNALRVKELALGKGHPETIDIYLNIGMVHMSKGNNELALAHYDTTLIILDNDNLNLPLKRARTLNNSAIVFIQLKNWDKAIENSLQACQIIERIFGVKHESYLQYQSNLAWAYHKKGEFHKAFTLFEQGFQERMRYVAENFEWLSDVQRETFWKQQIGFFNKMYNFVVDAANEIPETVGLLYNEALLNKGKLLEAHIRKQSTGSAQLDEEREELRQSRVQLSKAETDGTLDKPAIQKLRNKADSLDKDLALKWSAYGQQHQHLTIQWKDVQQALLSAETAIEMVRYFDETLKEYTYVALVISRDRPFPQLVPLCAESTLQKLNLKVQLHELYTLLWEPLKPFLGSSKTIYYSPTGLLDQVPFHALYKGEEETKVLVVHSSNRRGVVPEEPTLVTNENIAYLLDNYSLHQLTSTRFLVKDTNSLKSHLPTPTIVLLGGIDYNALPSRQGPIQAQKNRKAEKRSAGMNGRALNYLPGTLEEVQNIHSLALSNGWKSTCYTGSNASEEVLLECSVDTSVNVLHIATHGFAFEQVKQENSNLSGPSFRAHTNPMVRSGLVLAGGNWSWLGSDTLMRTGKTENGILTALEVSHLKLTHIDLVVLSACETGLGKVEGGEGTFGLKRGFKMAGARNIIISLWAVPDKETMELMNAFYNALSPTTSTAQAFEIAQQTLRKKYPTQPALWAGFVLVR